MFLKKLVDVLDEFCEILGFVKFVSFLQIVDYHAKCEFCARKKEEKDKNRTDSQTEQVNSIHSKLRNHETNKKFHPPSDDDVPTKQNIRKAHGKYHWIWGISPPLDKNH